MVHLNTYHLIRLVLLLSIWSTVTQAKTAVMIVDMQPGFYQNYTYPEITERANALVFEELVQGQLEAIHWAQQERLLILKVLFEGYGPPMRHITEALNDYPNAFYFQKTSNGLFEPRNKYLFFVEDFFAEQEIDHIILFGVNASACVHQTLLGLLDRGVKVTLYLPGTANFYHPSLIPGLKMTGSSTIETKIRFRNTHPYFNQITEMYELARLTGLPAEPISEDNPTPSNQGSKAVGTEACRQLVGKSSLNRSS